MYRSSTEAKGGILGLGDVEERLGGEWVRVAVIVRPPRDPTPRGTTARRSADPNQQYCWFPFVDPSLEYSRKCLSRVIGSGVHPTSFDMWRLSVDPSSDPSSPKVVKALRTLRSAAAARTVSRRESGRVTSTDAPARPEWPRRPNEDGRLGDPAISVPGP